jgi:hypothetical protein
MLPHAPPKSCSTGSIHGSQRSETTMTEVLVRAEGLDVNEVPDGYVIYQTEADRVHYLNKTAAIVFELCDGARGTDDIVARVSKMFEVEGTAHGEIEACVQSLLKEGLVLSRSK